MVRTSASQAGNTGSTPVGSTLLKGTIFMSLFLLKYNNDSILYFRFYRVALHTLLVRVKINQIFGCNLPCFGMAGICGCFFNNGRSDFNSESFY